MYRGEICKTLLCQTHYPNVSYVLRLLFSPLSHFSNFESLLRATPISSCQMHKRRQEVERGSPDPLPDTANYLIQTILKTHNFRDLTIPYIHVTSLTHLKKFSGAAHDWKESSRNKKRARRLAILYCYNDSNLKSLPENSYNFKTSAPWTRTYHMNQDLPQESERTTWTSTCHMRSSEGLIGRKVFELHDW